MYKRTNIANLNKIGLHKDCLDKINKMHEKFIEEEENNKLTLEEYNMENKNLKEKILMLEKLLHDNNEKYINLTKTLNTFLNRYGFNNLNNLEEFIKKNVIIMDNIKTDKYEHDHINKNSDIKEPKINGSVEPQIVDNINKNSEPIVSIKTDKSKVEIESHTLPFIDKNSEPIISNTEQKINVGIVEGNIEADKEFDKIINPKNMI